MQEPRRYTIPLDLFRNHGLLLALWTTAKYRWPRNYDGGMSDGINLTMDFIATPRTLKRIDEFVKALLKYKDTENYTPDITAKMFAWKG